MRVIGILGLALSLAVPAMAQDTSIVIRGSSRDGAGSADTTITIHRRGQPDQVVRVTGKLSTELRANLERQVDESRRAMANVRESSRMVEGQQLEARRALGAMRESNRVLESRQLDLARRQAEAAGEMGSVMLARPSRDLAGRTMQVFAAKPRIGITVDIRARDSDKYGAYVSAVTPGGPAAKAGIRAGDVITRLAGKSLTTNDDTPREEGSSAPGLRLLQVASKLEAGKSVDLEYRRGNDTRKTSILPADDDGWVYAIDGVPSAGTIMARPGVPSGGTFGFMQGAPSTGRNTMVPRSGGGAGAGAVATPGEPFEARFFENFARGAGGNRVAMISNFGGPLADLELAPINEKLGSYFGVTEGVLVIDVPAKDNLGLTPGDVITSIDGRKVGTPSQLFRVLGTYDRGEEFKIQVTRQRRTETIVSKAP
ncbi:MAG: PDZ domain-containing protein [Gemmatimonadota bacterium]